MTALNDQINLTFSKLLYDYYNHASFAAVLQHQR